MRDRRQLDANAAINLAVVRGVVAIALILAVGGIGLVGIKAPVPEWMGNALIAITGGLIGYLSRDPKHTAQVSTEHAETVNVEADLPPKE